MSGKRNAADGSAHWRLLGVVCALILCALFWHDGHQLAEEARSAAPTGEPGAERRNAEAKAAKTAGWAAKPATCGHDVSVEGGAGATDFSPAAYIERMKEEGWQAQLITGFAIGPLDAIYAVSGENAMLCAQSGQNVYMILAQADENALYALGADAVFE
ncbi:MAG: hypothetical protein ACLS7Z_03885 [Christensenellales bacterium]